ncbi:MAG: site-specific integrase [Methanoregula sp.]|nr:site-specific integrase [Methanoregula sp.]
MNPQYEKTRGLNITPEDTELIRSFLEDLEGQGEISQHTLHGIEKSLRLWTDELEYSDLTTGMLNRAVATIKKRGYKPNTQRHHIGNLKRFLIWMNETGKNNIDLKTIDKIKAPGIDYNTKKPAQMLDEDEIRKLIDTCRHPRDKALFSMLYEGSFRPVELVRMTWDQVKFDDYGIIVNTAEKTGKPRYIRLITSRPYLAAWQAAYPAERTDDAQIFIATIKPHQPIGYRGMQHLLRRIVKESGIKKKISLYLFRHSRITNLLQQEYPESAIKLQAWGNLRTPMLATYAHLDGSYMDNVMLGRAGIVQTEKKKKSEALKVEQCPQCHAINAPGARFCMICGRSLTEDAAATQDNLLMRLKTIAKERPGELIEALKNL